MSDLVALASLSHRDPITEAFLAQIKPANIIASGSSYKFCRVACGDADFYPRVGPTMGWDTAAGQAVLQAAGGLVLDASASPMTYTTESLRNGPFLALGDPDLRNDMGPIFTAIIRDQRRVETDIAEAT